MVGESKETSILGEPSVEAQRPKIEVKDNIVVWGEQTERFIGANQTLRELVRKDLHFSFRIENPGKEEAIIIVRG